MFSTRVSAFAAKAGLVGGPVLFFLTVFSFDDPVQSFLQGVLGTNDEIHFLHFLAIALYSPLAARQLSRAETAARTSIMSTAAMTVVPDVNARVL